MPSIAVRRVERAKLDTSIVSFEALQSLAGSCLAWCGPYRTQRTDSGETGQILRSAQLRDAAHEVFPASCHTPFNAAQFDAFNSFLHLRERLCPLDRQPVGEVAAELSRPKALLITDWSASLFDGALSPVTDGFLNEDAMPPWDTWITLVNIEGAYGLACLLSWVPEWIGNQVDSAITLDAAECLSWARIDRQRLTLNDWGKPFAE